MQLNSKPERFLVNLRDIQAITGRTYRTSIRIAQKIRAANNKGAKDFITAEEVSKFLRVREEDVKRFLK
jgi:hypothetical protein